MLNLQKNMKTNLLYMNLDEDLAKSPLKQMKYYMFIESGTRQSRVLCLIFFKIPQNMDFKLLFPILEICHELNHFNESSKV